MKHSVWARREAIKPFMRSRHGWWQNVNTMLRFIWIQEVPENTSPPPVISSLDKERCTVETQGGKFCKVLSVFGEIWSTVSFSSFPDEGRSVLRALFSQKKAWGRTGQEMRQSPIRNLCCGSLTSEQFSSWIIIPVLWMAGLRSQKAR